MNVEEMSFEKIKKQKYLLEEYKKLLEELKTNAFTKKIVNENYGKKVVDIYKTLEEELLNNTSTLFFPRDIVLIYPNIKYLHAKQNITCDFSGSIIRKNEEYLYYRPLLHNIDKNTAYVLRDTIKVSTEYEQYLPDNIFDFENLDMNIATLPSDNEISYEELNRKYGGLSLVKLKRK